MSFVPPAADPVVMTREAILAGAADEDAESDKPLLSPAASVLLACASALIFAFVDFQVLGEVDAAILYGISIGACAWSASLRFLWIVTGACVLLTCAGQAFGPAPETDDMILGLLWIDRSFVAVELVALAGFVHLWMLQSERLTATKTLLRHQNRALWESESWLRATFEQAVAGVAHVDLTGRMLRVNERFCDLTGYHRDEMLGVNYADLNHPEDREAAAAQRRELLTGAARSCTLEERYLCKDGTHRWVNVARSLVRETSGEPAYFIVMVEDISRRKLAEQELLDLKESLEVRVAERTRELTESDYRLHQTEAILRHAQKMEAIGQLTGGVSHDFNNMLTTIIGNLELIARRPDDAARTQRLARSALNSAENGARLVQHLLAFSRRQKLDPQTVRIEEIITSALPLWQHALGETIALSPDIADGIWCCRIDRAQIEAALLNLVVNARDAMATTGGRLTVRACNATIPEGSAARLPIGDYVLLSVGDTGPGIPADIRQRVFEPFFTTKDAGKGSGLGLSMVHGFVRQSGGDVRIDSAEGVGTTVMLYLPRAEPDELPDRAGEEPSLDGKPPDATILVVEDEEPIRRVASEALEAAGYRVLLAGDAREALAILKETRRIDLVVSDIVMPGGMSGYDLARSIRRSDRPLPVLLMTGYAPALGAQLLDKATFEVLRKPFRATELCARVRQILESSPQP